jgi:hypothetical protein
MSASESCRRCSPRPIWRSSTLKPLASLARRIAHIWQWELTGHANTDRVLSDGFALRFRLLNVEYWTTGDYTKIVSILRVTIETLQIYAITQSI